MKNGGFLTGKYQNLQELAGKTLQPLGFSLQLPRAFQHIFRTLGDVATQHFETSSHGDLLAPPIAGHERDKWSQHNRGPSRIEQATHQPIRVYRTSYCKNDQRSAAGESHEFRGLSLSLSQVQLAASRMLQLATGSCVPQIPE